MVDQKIETVSEVVTPTTKFPRGVGIKLKLGDNRGYYFGPMFCGEAGKKMQDLLDEMTALDQQEKTPRYFSEMSRLLKRFAAESLRLYYGDRAEEIAERGITMPLKHDLTFAVSAGIVPYKVEEEIGAADSKNVSEPLSK